MNKIMQEALLFLSTVAIIVILLSVFTPPQAL